MTLALSAPFDTPGYHAPWWLPGGHAQTIWSALLARPAPSPSPPPSRSRAPDYRRERWATPDGDFIDVDFQEAPATPGGNGQAAELLVLFHGLEGSSHSHYAKAFAQAAHHAGWHFAVPHFRGCSGELNHAPRAYHSGDFAEIGWILQRLCERHGAPVRVVGVSLGGNALLRWADESGDSAHRVARSIAAVCAPVDLTASGQAIGRGFNRQVYTRMFLRSMKPKAMAKLAQHPGLFDAARMRAARDLYDFDDLFTAPLHGFRDTDDYWLRASAKPHLHSIRLPALVVNARNDPFVPAASLPGVSDVGSWVTLWQPAHGGHVGFPQGSFPGDVATLPRLVMGWMSALD